jgi:hypothetical protein
MRTISLSRPAAVRVNHCWHVLILWLALAGATGAFAQTGTVQFSQLTFSALSTDSNATITVAFSGSTDTVAAVQFSTMNGTAVAGTNFVSLTTNLTFSVTNGSSSNATLVVDILGNIAPGTTQTVGLVLSDPAGATLGAMSNAVLQIINTNQEQVEFSTAVFNVPTTDSVAEITILRTGVTDGTATVDFATSNGTAVDQTDYTGTNGTATFLPGDVSNSFEIAILNNSVPPGSSLTVNLTLANVTGGASLGNPNTAVLNINGSAVIQFSQASYAVLERAGSAIVTVLRTGDPSGQATVHYVTSDGTAMSPTNYIGSNGTLTFSPGVQTQTLSFVIQPQKTFESNRTVDVSLDSASGAQLGPTSEAVVTIVNDHTQTITFTNDAGTVTLMLQHAGEIDGTLDDIVLSFTDQSSVMSIKVNKGRSGTGILQLNSITGDGDCRLIDAGNVDLVGDGLQLGGFLGQLRIHDIVAGGMLTARGGPGQTTRIYAHEIGTNATIQIGARIGALDAAQIDPGVTIAAPSVGVMAVIGDKRHGLAGDFGASMELTGAGI